MPNIPYSWFGFLYSFTKSTIWGLTPFLYFTIIAMKNYELFKKEQFKKCQATVAWFESDELQGWCGEVITIFYSYSCPELVKIRGNWYKFIYEGSRKDWSITGSITTSKQLTAFYWRDWRDLPKMNLKDFENEYFYTAINWLY